METTNSQKILKVYVALSLFSTLAASFIWGVNTLFLLDAGLSITEAFAANAFYTLGQVIFEVPTGVLADTRGRRASYLLGTFTLAAATLLYLVLWQINAGFVAWAIASALLGLGFTFFSGATEAWLVDGLKATGYKGNLESAFAKGQIASGVAMLIGTFAGGLVAQNTNLGVPYIIRIFMLGVTFIAAFLFMHDIGFKPDKGSSPLGAVKNVLKASYDHGFRNPSVRWMMLTWPFVFGVGVYGFYAAQPYLLELFGNPESYAVAGLAASIVAATNILGGVLVPRAGRIFKKRTTLLIITILISSAVLLLLGITTNFYLALGLFAIWGIIFAATFPVRQAYLNGLIPSHDRATVLSSDNLLGSAGGVISQPALGKVADVWGYSASYIVSGFVQLLALPFMLLARKQNASSDPIKNNAAKVEATPVVPA